MKASFLSSLAYKSEAAAPGKEVDRWSIAHATSFPNPALHHRSTSFPSQYYYHRIEGTLHASSKFAQRPLVMKS